MIILGSKFELVHDHGRSPSESCVEVIIQNSQGLLAGRAGRRASRRKVSNANAGGGNVESLVEVTRRSFGVLVAEGGEFGLGVDHGGTGAVPVESDFANGGHCGS